MEKDDELTALARKYAISVDLYELLGIDALTAKEEKEVQRAWRKRSLKHHPDKAGANFDADKWQLLERARDVLLNATAREVYNNDRSALLRRETEKKALNAKKRAMVEDLEARERGHTVKKARDVQCNGISEQEKRNLAEAGRKRMEERQRDMREAEERMRRAEEEQARAQRATEIATPLESEAEPELKLDGDGDQYDSREAEVQRRLRELEDRKSAKRAAKKAAKDSGVAPSVIALASPDPLKTGAQADEKKGPSSTKSFSFSTPKATPASTVGTPRVKGDFSSTMARLKAAQVEKERRKAEEAAAMQVDTAQ